MPYTWSTGETITAAKLNKKAIDVVMVGGGGGGGTGPATTIGGGGGGGGGVLQLRLLPNISDSFSITIGAGGATATDGNNTTFGAFTAFLGKGGGAPIGGHSGVGPSSRQGAHGGRSNFLFSPSTVRGGSGGGGAGGNGGDGRTPPSADPVGAPGGPGLCVQVTGESNYFGGGGGGSSAITFEDGGIGGGGHGRSNSPTPVAAAAGAVNTGGGGGGSFNPAGPGAAGGSGVVIVGYDGPTQATGGTITTANGRTIHTFTSGPATFTWTG
jgi:mucin-19